MQAIAPWLPLLQILVLIAGAIIPFIAVASEETEKVLPRGAYALQAAACIAVSLVCLLVAGFFQIPTILAIGIIALVTIPLYRAMVRRLRDAGRGKGLALLGALPFAGLLVVPLLAVYPPSVSANGSAGARN